MSHSDDHQRHAESLSDVPGIPVPLYRGREGAFEVKFLIDPAIADEILARAREEMQPDPHSDPKYGDGYQINSIYFDNDQFSVFRRLGSYRRRKYRVRRYGQSPQVFLERKAKSRGVVRKRRTLVHEDELNFVTAPASTAEWSGHWFRRRLEKRGLRPTCHIAYERIARVGVAQDGPIRLTVDRNLVCRPTTDMHFPCLDAGQPIFADKRILELKFRSILPPLFNALVRDYELTPMSISKYRMGVVACGLHVGLCEKSVEPPGASGAAHASDSNLRSA